MKPNIFRSQDAAHLNVDLLIDVGHERNSHEAEEVCPDACGTNSQRNDGGSEQQTKESLQLRHIVKHRTEGSERATHQTES